MPEVEVCWYEDEEWRGFLPLQPRSELLHLHVFDTWVAGVHHYPDAAIHESFAPGMQLALVAEPENPHDAAAIGVWNAERTLKVGHVPAVIVAKLPTNERTALSLSEQLDAGGRTTLRILVSREPVSLRVVPGSEELAGRMRSTVARLKKQAARGVPHEPKVEADPMDQMAQMLKDLSKRPRQT
jgi:HIRAN domain